MRSTFFAILTISVLYWPPIRRWMSRWGARTSDLTRVMTGDALLASRARGVPHDATHAARSETARGNVARGESGGDSRDATFGRVTPARRGELAEWREGAGRMGRV